MDKFCLGCSVELFYSQEGISLYLRPRQNRYTYIKCKKFFFFLWKEKHNFITKDIESRKYLIIIFKLVLAGGPNNVGTQ